MATPRPYKPTSADLAWVKLVWGSLVDGGTWGPAYGVMVKNATAQTMTLTLKSPLWDDVFWHRTAQVFGAINVTVVDATDGPTHGKERQ